MEDRRILVVTADAVEFTGSMTYGFMLACKYPVFKMPRLFGHIEVDPKPGWHALRVFEGGKGCLLTGGFSPDASDEWERRILDGIPSCTLLMTVAAFAWWEVLCTKHGVELEHHHFAGALATSPPMFQLGDELRQGLTAEGAETLRQHGIDS